MTTYKDREDRLITEMETRTEYNNGLTIPVLCKRVLDYQVEVHYNQSFKKLRRRLMSRAPTILRELREMGDSARADRYDDTVKYVCLYYLVKEPEDLTKIWQIKRMIKRTREKYRSGSRYNNTNINKHQYYLLPPRLLQKDRRWRCVHVIEGLNGHLLDLRDMWVEKMISGIENTIRERMKERDILIGLEEERKNRK